MAKDNDEQSLRDYTNRKRRVKRRRNIFIISLILIFAVVGVAYVYHLYNRNYKSYQVIKTTEANGENAQGYLSYGNAIVKYSKDGAVAIDKDGKLLWNGSYEMKAPIADTCGKYVVIADKGDKDLQIFNGKGIAGSINTLYNILKVEIASQGVVAVLMEDNQNNYITLYDVDGTVLGEKVTNVNNAGYPMDISLSDDGEKLVISYLSVTKGELISTVAFFNFGEVGQSYTDRFVGGYEFKDMVLPRVAFVNNDTVCVYKENGFLIYSMSEIPNMTYEENLEGKIQSILYNDKHVGVVLDAGEAAPKKLLLYDLTGKKVLEKTIDINYEKIYITDEEIILHNNLSCRIMKLNGNVKFEYTFDSNIAAIYPANHLDRYFLVEGKNISEILLVE